MKAEIMDLRPVAAALVTLAMVCAMAPAAAYAAPARDQKAKIGGITYQLSDRFGSAEVWRVPSKRTVTVPRTVRHKGKTYRVYAMFAPIPKRVRVLVIKARLLVDRGGVPNGYLAGSDINIRCSDVGTFEWFHNSGCPRTELVG